jgi:putative SOS response-associated peptidase YedK
MPTLLESYERLACGGRYSLASWVRANEPIETCVITTTDPNDLAKGMHDRMPVILNADTGREWLDPQADPADLQKLLQAYSGSDLDAHPVSTRVNSPRNQGPGLIQPQAS